MPTTGYILILVVLLLGAAIAALGDWTGSRVGKARLSLFNLRPRKTALLVTIITGSLISASTLLVLLTASERLRRGIFELKKIENKLSETRREVNEARSERDAVQQRLEEINRFLKTATAEQARTQAKLKTVQRQLNQVSRQAGGLRQDIQQLRNERQILIRQRRELVQQRQRVETKLAQQDREIVARDREIVAQDREIVARDREISVRDRAISQKEARLNALETEQSQLEGELQTLYQVFERVRTGNVAIARGQVIAAGVVRVIDPEATSQAVDQLLRDANCAAIERTQPGTACTNKRVVQITSAQVRQLIDRIDDGRDYVVRILSAGNYVTGETTVQVFAVAEVNQKIFSTGDLVASISLESPATLPEKDIERRIERLLAVVQFRGSQIGVVNNTPVVGDGRVVTLIRFLEQLQQYASPLEVRALARTDNYTFGPLKIDLVAMQNGEVVLSTTPEPP